MTMRDGKGRNGQKRLSFGRILIILVLPENISRILTEEPGEKRKVTIQAGRIGVLTIKKANQAGNGF